MERITYTRRDFLRHLTVFSAAALLPLSATDASASGALVPLGALRRFPVGHFEKVGLPNGQFAYVRRLPGKAPAFLVLNAACTHKGCPVAWEAAVNQFVCPCHGGRYNAEGRNIAGPPPRPLQRLRTKVIDRTLYAVV